jgi:hypothetical protein
MSKTFDFGDADVSRTSFKRIKSSADSFATGGRRFEDVSWEDIQHDPARRSEGIEELRALVAGENLDASADLIVQEQLLALEDPNLDEAEQITRWKRIRKAVPTTFARIAAHPVFVALVTAEAKKQLGLPPGG